MSVLKSATGRLVIACSSAAAVAYGGSALAAGCINVATSGYLECVTAITVPGNPIRTFDISWVDAKRGLYFLGDRSNFGIDIIDTKTNSYIGRAGGFLGPLSAPGVVATPTTNVNNNISGPDGVVSHGRWLYGGDGNSTLRVYDIADPTNPVFKVAISTGGTTRVDEMALTPDGSIIVVANNAEDPPFITMMHANGDGASNTMSASSIISKIIIDPTLVPSGAGLSIEQSAWDPRLGKFIVSVPIIAGNPSGCNYGQSPGAITCNGGMAIIDPSAVTAGKYTVPAADVVPLVGCGPNGIAVGPGHQVGEACNPGNVPSNVGTTIVTDEAPYYQVQTEGVTGGDEIWYDAGTDKYYVGASKNGPNAGATKFLSPALGVIDPKTKHTIQTIPASSNSHSIAADSKRHYVYDPQVAPTSVVGSGGDATTNGAAICGGTNGCIGVFRPRVLPRRDGDDDDRGHYGDRDDRGDRDHRGDWDRRDD